MSEYFFGRKIAKNNRVRRSRPGHPVRRRRFVLFFFFEHDRRKCTIFINRSAVTWKSWEPVLPGNEVKRARKGAYMHALMQFVFLRSPGVIIN